ncbi:MAG: efflux RND transporter periplasmic adaptor subunit [Chromatiales bacterium]|jgi:macrolide-specific efflux system membrane fusion protein|nr:efflux RND transporter periplasmic adaptor subunit [Chromatiales bacterium]
MRRFKFALIVVAVLALIGLAVYQLWPKSGGNDVMVTAVTRGDIEDVVTASGILQPRDYVDVGTQVSGQLMKLHVDIGDSVKKGDLLAEIDPTVYLARVDASRAQLRNQRAQLQERHAQLVLAEQQDTRQHNLMAQKATTDEAVQSAQANLASVKAQIEAIEAQIQQTESSLKGDGANLGYTKIYAPMSGTVVSLTARQGQTLNANQQAPIVLTIADLSVMTVQAQVSEADVSKLRVGMDVYFTTLGNRGERFYGKLRQIRPTPEVLNNVVLYDALFDVPNPERKLMTQMTAQVFFVLAAARDALIVPMTAIASAEPQASGEVARRQRPSSENSGSDAAANTAAGRGERGQRQQGERHGLRPEGISVKRAATVNVIIDKGRTETRHVEVGVTNRVSAQILSGLQEGEEVVVGQRRPEAERAAASGAPRMPPRI